MRIQGPAARLTILLDEKDQRHHRPLYVEIIHRAHAEGLAGATAVRGIEGFAGGSEIHTRHLLAHKDHLPIAITIVDSHDRIDAFIHNVGELLDKGIVLLDDVEVVRFHRDPPTPRGRPRDTPRSQSV